MPANIKQHIPIFICSTQNDLKEHREKIWQLMEKLKLGVNGMEIFGARTNKPLDTCLQEVSKCKILIGIIGMRYGSIDDETGKSFVQRECEAAIKSELEILIYLIDEENSSISPNYVDKDEHATKLMEFKETLKKIHTVDTYLSPDDLVEKIELSLMRLLKKKKYLVEDAKIEPLSDAKQTIATLDKFDLMPARFTGREIELSIKFEGTATSVSAKRCKTLSLTRGSALSRDITVVQPRNTEDNLTFLRTIYAERDLCDFLFDSEEKKEYRISVRLAFGVERYIVTKSGEEFRVGTVYNLMAGLRGLDGPSILVDDETGEKIDIHNYLTNRDVKAIILSKVH